MELIFLAIGVILGVLLMVERNQRLERKTFEEVDSEVRAELELYRNLTTSLKKDVVFLRRKIQALKKSK